MNTRETDYSGYYAMNQIRKYKGVDVGGARRGDPLPERVHRQDKDSEVREQNAGSGPSPDRQGIHGGLKSQKSVNSDRRINPDVTGEPPTSGRVAYNPGPDGQQLSDRYNIDFVKAGQADRVQRMEDAFGSQRVRSWAEEGMPVETMGKPRDMEAFRTRQANRSEEIPDDIERQNQASYQRNVYREEEEGPAGNAEAPDIVRQVVSKPGRSLDGEVQREMESKMGGDFSDVQLHTGPEAAAAADSINARAFTVGNHVAFNQGEYNPTSDAGKKVLAHELTHVRQQTGGTVSLLPIEDGNHLPALAHAGESFHLQPKLEVSSPDDPAEKEAEAVADRVVEMDTPEPSVTAQPSDTSEATGGGGAEQAQERIGRAATAESATTSPTESLGKTGVIDSESTVQREAQELDDIDIPEHGSVRERTEAGLDAEVSDLNLRFEATLPETTLLDDGEQHVYVKDSTEIRMWFSEDRYLDPTPRLSVEFSPGLQVDPDQWGYPSVEIHTLWYRPTERDLSLRKDVGRFGIREKAPYVSDIITDEMEEFLFEIFPHAMVIEGYNPYEDPLIEYRLEELFDNMLAMGTGELPELSETSVAAHLTVDEPIERQITDLDPDMLADADVPELDDLDGVHMTLPEGTSSWLTADVSGGLPGDDEPIRIDEVRLDPDEDIRVRGTSGITSNVTVVRISEFTIGHGGDIDMDYQLLTEQIEGFRNNIEGIQAGLEGSIPDDSVYEEPIDEELREALMDPFIEEELEPMLHQLLIENRHAVPQVDLVDALGIPTMCLD